MTDTTDKPLEKYRRKFDEAAATMAGAVAEAGLRAAVHVIQQETNAPGEMAVRSAVRRESMVRRVLEQSGELARGVLRGALPDPYAPEAFDAAVFHVAKLMATAWQTGGAR
jgi:hypothetical protein